MREESYILLGAYEYGADPHKKHLYGIAHVTTDKFDFTINYIDDSKLLELYEKNEEACDFSVKDGLVFWKGHPVPISKDTARILGKSVSLGILEPCFYEILNRLMSEDIYFISDELSSTMTKLPYFPFEGVCKLSELVYMEESLDIIATYTIQGKRAQKHLLDSTGPTTRVNNFRLLANQEDLLPSTQELLTKVRDVTIAGKLYGIYELKNVYTHIPIVKSLGYLSLNLLCFLKSKAVYYHNLAVCLSKLLASKEKFKLKNQLPTKIFSLREQDDGRSTKVTYSVSRDLEGMDTLVTFLTKTGVREGITDDSLKKSIRKLGFDDIQEFVAYNVLKLKTEHVVSSIGEIELYSSYLDKTHKLRSYYELMLMLQRVSLTEVKPSPRHLRFSGTYGNSTGEITVKVSGGND